MRRQPKMKQQASRLRKKLSDTKAYIQEQTTLFSTKAMRPSMIPSNLQRTSPSNFGWILARTTKQSIKRWVQRDYGTEKHEKARTRKFSNENRQSENFCSESSSSLTKTTPSVKIIHVSRYESLSRYKKVHEDQNAQEQRQHSIWQNLNRSLDERLINSVTRNVPTQPAWKTVITKSVIQCQQHWLSTTPASATDNSIDRWHQWASWSA